MSHLYLLHASEAVRCTHSLGLAWYLLPTPHTNTTQFKSPKMSKTGGKRAHLPTHRRLRSHKRPPPSLRQCRAITQCHPHTSVACWRRRSSKQEASRLGVKFDQITKIGGRKAHLPWHRRPRSHKRPPPSLRQCRAIAQCQPHTPGACWRRRSSKQEALRLGGMLSKVEKLDGYSVAPPPEEPQTAAPESPTVSGHAIMSTAHAGCLLASEEQQTRSVEAGWHF